MLPESTCHLNPPYGDSSFLEGRLHFMASMGGVAIRVACSLPCLSKACSLPYKPRHSVINWLKYVNIWLIWRPTLNSFVANKSPLFGATFPGLDWPLFILSQGLGSAAATEIKNLRRLKRVTETSTVTPSMINAHPYPRIYCSVYIRAFDKGIGHSEA